MCQVYLQLAMCSRQASECFARGVSRWPVRVGGQFRWPWHWPLTQHLGDHRCSLPVASRIEQDLDGRQWQHGDPSATDDDSVHMVQVRSGDYHVAHWAYSLYALQDLDLDAVDHSEGSADGAHVATIPAGLVAHHGAAQPFDQLGRGYVINQEIQVPRIDRQSMEGEGGASADSQVRKALETIKNTSSWSWPGKKDKRELTADERWALIRAAMEDQASGAMHVDPGTKDYKYTRAEVETRIAMTAGLLCIVP